MSTNTETILPPAAGARPHAGVRSWPGALVALLLGTMLLYGVGFASAPLLHNAAHDTRHSQGFPCH
jgi:cobalt transporter subunit CbtB